jgi:cell division protease FtsH
LESQLAVALGGRLAEEIIYGEDMVTTGASNDIQQVASIAKRMVKEWGLSERVGNVALSERESFVFVLF